jgi:hypothetical protein
MPAKKKKKGPKPVPKHIPFFPLFEAAMWNKVLVRDYSSFIPGSNIRGAGQRGLTYWYNKILCPARGNGWNRNECVYVFLKGDSDKAFIEWTKTQKPTFDVIQSN